jgi:hypothetical protein
MIGFRTYRSARQLSRLGSLVALISISPVLVTSAIAQPAAPPGVDVVNPSLPAGGVYTIAGGQKLISEAASAVSAQNYTLAAKKLLEARLLMNQLSNFYQGLTSTFLGIDNQASESARRKALESAQLRDQSTYQLALVYRANNQPELAIPLLVEIIRSQSPTRPLGQQSYQQLLELGFVDVAYPRGGVTPPAPAPKTAPTESAPTAPPAPAPTSK